MKKTFHNKPLLIAVVLLVLFKLIATVANLLSPPQAFLEWLTFPSLAYFMFAVIVFSKTGWLLGLIVAFLIICYFVQIITLLLLTINRRGASVASIILIICCIPDTLFHLLYIPSMPLLSIGLIYNLVLIVMLVLLCRSRPGAPTITNIGPSKV